MIALRRAAAADVEAIAVLVHDAYTKWVPLMGVKPVPMLVDYDRAVVESRIDLHCIDGRLAALIETRPSEQSLFVANVAVAPAHQGCGIGRALLSHAEGVAVASGLHVTRLFVNEVMEANIRLYENVGYRRTRRVPFRLDMHKRL